MRKMLTAILLAFGLLVGAGGLAAPAQAWWGTTAHYAAKGAAVPDGTPIVVTRMDGSAYRLYWGDYMTNAWRVCPWPYGAYRLRVTGPAGTTRTLSVNECSFPTKEGTYEYKVLAA
jgi:hypothetical protein